MYFVKRIIKSIIRTWNDLLYSANALFLSKAAISQNYKIKSESVFTATAVSEIKIIILDRITSEPDKVNVLFSNWVFYVIMVMIWPQSTEHIITSFYLDLTLSISKKGERMPQDRTDVRIKNPNTCTLLNISLKLKYTNLVRRNY